MQQWMSTQVICRKACATRGGVSHVHAMKEEHAPALRDFVQAEQQKGDNDELRLGVGELRSTIFEIPKRTSTSRRTASSIQFLEEYRREVDQAARHVTIYPSEIVGPQHHVDYEPHRFKHWRTLGVHCLPLARDGQQV